MDNIIHTAGCQPLFKVGQSVIYHRSKATAEAVGLPLTERAVVEDVITDDGITTFNTPLYDISFPLTGRALVQERELSPAAAIDKCRP